MRGSVIALVVLCCLGGPASAENSSAWIDIRSTLFPARPVSETAGMVKVVAPKRADDAAVVPVSVTIGADVITRVRAMTLIIDNNPAPVVAMVTFGDAYRTGGDVGDRTVEFRVRLDQLSPVRAVLELEDGSLHMGSQFVAGSGGCSSTSVKDVDQALSNLGQTRLKVTTDRTRGEMWREVQAQIRHPNFSGMQIDAKTNGYTPAHFVDRVEFLVGSQSLATLATGISISEDPNIRLTFASPSTDPMRMTARDSNGNMFEASATAHEAMH